MVRDTEICYPLDIYLASLLDYTTSSGALIATHIAKGPNLYLGPTAPTVIPKIMVGAGSKKARRCHAGLLLLKRKFELKKVSK